MAKKTGLGDTIKGVVKTFSDVLFKSAFSSVNDQADALMTKVHDRALILEERLVKRVSASMLLGIAVLFLVLSVLFYLIEYRLFTKTHAFLAVGIVLLLVAFFLKYKNLNEERR